MSEFDDPDLRQQLGRLSGPYPDDNAAFAAWQRRVGQARRRRAMAWTSGAALSLIFGMVAVAALQSPTRHTVVPGKSSETSAEFTVSVASTEPETTDPSTTESTAPDTSAPTTLAPDTTPTIAVVDTSAPAVEGDAGSGSQSGAGANGNGGSPTSAAPVTPPSATQSFDTPGGSITVHNDGDDLNLVATNAAPGYRARVEDSSGSKVRVTFRSGDHEFEITVREDDGVMQSDVVDKSDGDRDTVPDETSGGGSGSNSGSGSGRDRDRDEGGGGSSGGGGDHD